MRDGRFRALARLPLIINASLELDEVLGIVMEQALALTAAERGALMLHDPQEGMRPCVLHGFQQHEWHRPRLAFARRVVQRVLDGGDGCLTSDAQPDTPTDLLAGIGLQSILCAPIRTRGAHIGAIYVERSLVHGVFDADDLEMLEALGLQAGIAIENAQRYGQAVARGRAEAAGSLAAETAALIAALMPSEAPRIPGFHLAARWHSSHDVSADFYDAFRLGDREGWGLVVADVAASGTPAAIFMALTRSLIRGSAAASRSPTEAIERANRLIYADAPAGLSVTALYAELLADGQVVYINAGHPAPLLFRRSSPPAAVPVGNHDVALGVVATARFSPQQLLMAPGDTLLLYSNGVTTAPNRHGEPFGRQRLGAICAAHGAAPAPEIASALLEELTLFTRGAALADDMLFVVLQRHA